jgi:hypothetical protein
MNDETNLRLKRIESQLEGMRGNQREMLVDLEILNRDLSEQRAFRKRTTAMLAAILAVLAVFIAASGPTRRLNPMAG